MRPLSDSYAIDGGRPGAARLAVLARVRASASEDFLLRAGLRAGQRCLDLGGGARELTARLAAIAAPGEVIAVDDFEALPGGLGEFDLVSAREVLSHLHDPLEALRRMWSLCRPGGVVAVEDTDVDAISSEPHSPALERCLELNRALTQARGGWHDVGPRLVALLEAAGFDRVEESIDQPVARDGDAKRVTELTFERMRPAVIAEGLTDDAELDALLAQLRQLAADPTTLIRQPRLHQVIGRRPPR
jgi:ubiquinone/menaquinone biosynthesis C-methylase UbiE